jgi:muconolactone delta-isomerase
MLFLVVSTPRPERPSDLVGRRQSFWPWIAAYQARGLCRHVYARAGRGAIAVLDVEDNDALHRILNEWG